MMGQYWMTYVIMIAITFALYWLMARLSGKRFELKKALIQSVFACIGLTIYFLILAS